MSCAAIRTPVVYAPSDGLSSAMRRADKAGPLDRHVFEAAVRPPLEARAYRVAYQRRILAAEAAGDVLEHFLVRRAGGRAGARF